MRKKEFEAELRYLATLSEAKSMLKEGLILPEEYDRIDTALLEKYRPVLGLLLAGKSGKKTE